VVKKYLLLLALSGCATTTINKTVDSASWKRKGPLMVTQKGVNVGVEGISYANLAKHPELTLKASWEITSKAGPDAKPKTSTINAHLPMLPLPAFIVRIKNDSSGALDFSKAEITLEEKGGATLKPYATTKDIVARVEADTLATRSELAGKKDTLEDLRKSTAGLPFLDAAVKVDSKQEFQGILVFQIDAHGFAGADEYFKKSPGEWTLHITNVTHPDGALEIAIPLVRVSVPTELECRADGERCEVVVPEAPPQEQQQGEEGGGGG
jgi:hypothetical protein